MHRQRRLCIRDRPGPRRPTPQGTERVPLARLWCTPGSFGAEAVPRRIGTPTPRDVRAPPPSRPRPPRMRSPRPATTSMPPTRTAAFFASLYGDPLRNAPGHGPRGPSGRHAMRSMRPLPARSVLSQDALRPRRSRHTRPIRTDPPQPRRAMGWSGALRFTRRVNGSPGA